MRQITGCDGHIAILLAMPTISSTTTPEAAVRLYLMYLDDPEKLVDPAEVKKLQAKVASAKDPIDRLKAISALNRAKAVDGSTYKYDFIKHAKTWADSEGVPEGAFREMGVPEDVLRAAGFGGGGRSGRGGTTRARTPSGRRPRTSPDRLAEGILGLDGPFTVKEVIESVGGSPVTVKNVISMLEAQRKIVPAGE
jgi:hypothetical protein